MIKSAFSTEPHYLHSVRGLLQLHELEVRGEADSPEADAIRDSIEKSWSLLSKIEQQRLTGLSEDLYSLSEAPASNAMNLQAQRELVEAYEALQTRNWDKALQLLRRWGTHLEPALEAFLKGRTWMEAGDNATAAVFFKRAAELEPENSNYKLLYMHTLTNVDPSAAERLTDEILDSCNRDSQAQIVKPLKHD